MTKIKKEKDEIYNLSILVNELRELLRNNVPTKDEVVPDSDNLAKSDMDKVFDIDIFFSRKPGMRRSVQLISSNSEGTGVKLSCMVALASLCDTMVSNKELNVDEGDIIQFMLTWIEMRKKKKEG